MTKKPTNKKRTAAVIAVVVALVIALGGTFAWQSINQQALNEVMSVTNPGGRLHDDFDGSSKDVYVENFGNQPIFARIRLDEYMEIGAGAGVKTGDDGVNNAISLAKDANINDVTTWTTHIPGTTAATTGIGQENSDDSLWNDTDKTFKTYWTWTMGGQDTVNNPNGQTVYMPTFNMNKNSLAADINGTAAGLDGSRWTGTPYDDYYKYTEGETADGVRTTNANVPSGAFYGIGNTTAGDVNSETNGKYGNGGEEGTNYKVVAETHTAQKTKTASVISMAEYWEMTDNDRAAFSGWVYDTDGWAYWSQPIAPKTATGLLLDKIEMKTEATPVDEWYYAINAVAQFITANDLGSTEGEGTGFFSQSDGKVPTDEALALLQGIGVNVGTLTVTAGDGTENIAGTAMTMTTGSTTSVAAAFSNAVEGATWQWESDNADVASVAADTNDPSRATVTAASSGSGTATITASYVTPAGTVIRTASFKVTIPPQDISVGDKVTLDGVTYTAMRAQTVTGKAAGEAEASEHSAILLLADTSVDTMVFGGSTYYNDWAHSSVRTYLQGTFAANNPSAAAKALTVTISTYGGTYAGKDSSGSSLVGTEIKTDDTFFLLSEADIDGKATNTSSGSSTGNAEAATYEYTAGSRLIDASGNIIADGVSTQTKIPTLGTTWFLRSPNRVYTGITGVKANVYSVVKINSTGDKYAVRPAFWYDLDSAGE